MIIEIIKVVLLYIFIMNFNIALASSHVANETIIEDKMCEVKAFHSGQTDKAKPSLTLNMTVKKHSSGVAYALEFELLNNSDKKLMIKTYSNNTRRFMPAIQLSNGQEISNEHKHYKMDGLEQPSFENIIIKAGDTKKWLLNIKDILQTNDTVKKALVNDNEGLLMVFFHFRYYLEDNSCDKQYKDGNINLYQNERFSLESYVLPN